MWRVEFSENLDEFDYQKNDLNFRKKHNQLQILHFWRLYKYL